MESSEQNGTSISEVIYPTMLVSIITQNNKIFMMSSL